MYILWVNSTYLRRFPFFSQEQSTQNDGQMPTLPLCEMCLEFWNGVITHSEPNSLTCLKDTLYSNCVKHNEVFRIISVTLTRVTCSKLFFNLPLSIITYQMATYIMGNCNSLEKKKKRYIMRTYVQEAPWNARIYKIQLI